MKEELISFETAKLAKELGFDMNFELYSDVKCYTPDGTFYDKQLLFQRPKRCKKRGALAPRQSELQKWLREEHNLIVEAPLYTASYFTYRIYKREETVKIISLGGVRLIKEKYEDALEEGLKAALNEINNSATTSVRMDIVDFSQDPPKIIKSSS